MTASPRGRTCEDYWPQVNDYVDGILPDAERAGLESHLATCPACERATADLGQMRRASRSLPPRRPRADAWQQIAVQLRREIPAAAAAPASVWTPRRAALAAAAVLLLAVAPTVWFVRQPAAPVVPQQAAAPAADPAGAGTARKAVNPPPPDLVRSIDEELKLAESHYERAIAGLEQIAKSDGGALEPALASTLQKNLGVIDQAIRESRAAIQTQPSSQLAQDSLFEALQRKVGLLEDTIALINVMRKGDQAGTAKIVKGINKT